MREAKGKPKIAVIRSIIVAIRFIQDVRSSLFAVRGSIFFVSSIPLELLTLEERIPSFVTLGKDCSAAAMVMDSIAEEKIKENIIKHRDRNCLFLYKNRECTRLAPL